MLPNNFLTMMRDLLPPSEFMSFLDTYKQNRSYGLRVNSQKLFPEQSLPFQLQPVPWCDTGFYYLPEEHPGRHPYHDAGLYYIQEPSAMAVVESMGVAASSVVLDLCAAPGGKSTQIASKLGKNGLLIANEIHPARARTLSENLERWGVVQSIVVNETPQKLAKQFPTFFTHILVDAPCSGEGMFRKDPEAIEHWSLSNLEICVARQKEVLESAVKMLRPDGILVYSTCTFNPYENEQMIEWLLQTFPDLEIEPLPPTVTNFISNGRSGWSNHPSPAIEKCGRLWPHLLKGEGHFVTKIRRQVNKQIQTNTQFQREKQKKRGKIEKLSTPQRKLWDSFCQETFHVEDGEPFAWIHPNTPDNAAFTLYADHLYLQPDTSINLSGLKVVRPGLYLGQMKQNRFEPGHGLAMAVQKEALLRQVDLESCGEEVISYLRGESLHVECERGWTVMTIDGHPLGFAKSDRRILKNHYPKHLRRNY